MDSGEKMDAGLEGFVGRRRGSWGRVAPVRVRRSRLPATRAARSLPWTPT